MGALCEEAQEMLDDNLERTKLAMDIVEQLKAAQSRIAEQDKRIATLEAENEMLRRGEKYWRDECGEDYSSLTKSKTRMATLEAALNEAADDIIFHGAGYFKEQELANKHRAIAKGEKC